MRYAIVDLESTGSRLEEGDRIIQIGAVIVEDHQVVDQQEMLINPKREIPLNIQQLTGIRQDQVDQAPTFAAVAQLWRHKLKDCVFMAHNLNHDLRFLVSEFQQAGYDFKPKAIDTVLLTKMVLPQASGFNLTDLSEDLGLEFENAHQALADAWQTHCLIDHLARQVGEFKEGLRQDLIAISRHFDHDEAEFFEAYQDFILREGPTPSKPKAPQTKAPLDSLQKAQLARLEELMQTKKHLVIEGKDRPLSDAWLKAYGQELYQQGKGSVLMALPSRWDLAAWEEFLGQEADLAVLLARSDYLDLDLFHRYCQQVDLAQLNQQELVVLGAVKSWLARTLTGRLDELNHELRILPQMKRALDPNRSSRTHEFYDKALAKAQKARWVLTLDQVLIQKGADIGQGRCIIIRDLHHYQGQAQLQAGRSLAMSQMLITLQQVEEDIQQGWGIKPNLLPHLQVAKASIRRLLTLLEVRFEKQFEASDQQVKRDLYLAERDPLVSQWQEDMNHFLKLQAYLALIDQESLQGLAEDHIKELDQSIQQVQALLQAMTQTQGYSFVRALEVQDHYYQMEWIYRTMDLARANPSNYTTAEVLIVSPGGFTGHLAYRDRLDLNHYSYWALPSYQQVVDFEVPEDYVVPAINQLSHLTRQAEELAALIKANNPDPAQFTTCKHLVIVNNRQQALTIYQAMKKAFQADHHVRILSQHASGSLNKIRRAANDKTGGILILQWQSILQDHFQLEDREVEVYWLRMPFDSLEHPMIQGLAAYQDLREDQVFDQIALERMMVHWLQGVDYLDQHFEVRSWWLLDERIFTKYYSKEIRQKLESSMAFNLKYKL